MRKALTRRLQIYVLCVPFPDAACQKYIVKQMNNISLCPFPKATALSRILPAPAKK